MTPVRSPFGVFAKIWLCIGLPFAIAAIVLFFVGDGSIHHPLSIVALCIGTNGVVFCFLGTLFFTIARREKNRLEHVRYSSDYIRYNGKVEHIECDRRIRMGRKIVGYALCSYHNESGELCRAKSKSFIVDEVNTSYNVSVYVNRRDEMDCVVGLSI